MLNQEQQIIRLALRALAAAEAGPTPTDLADAPLIELWQVLLNPRGAPVLYGYASGHPEIGTDTVRTSWLIALDRDAGWARSLNRYYRLGRSLEEAARPGVNRDPAQAEVAPGTYHYEYPGYTPLTDPVALDKLLAGHAAQLRAFADHHGIS